MRFHTSAAAWLMVRFLWDSHLSCSEWQNWCRYLCHKLWKLEWSCDFSNCPVCRDLLRNWHTLLTNLLVHSIRKQVWTQGTDHSTQRWAGETSLSAIQWLVIWPRWWRQLWRGSTSVEHSLNSEALACWLRCGDSSLSKALPSEPTLP